MIFPASYQTVRYGVHFAYYQILLLFYVRIKRKSDYEGQIIWYQVFPLYVSLTLSCITYDINIILIIIIIENMYNIWFKKRNRTHTHKKKE